MAESPCAVTEYALTNEIEDFAASVEFYFAYYAGRRVLEPAVRSAMRERLGKRFGLLQKLMHTRIPDFGDGKFPD